MAAINIGEHPSKRHFTEDSSISTQSTTPKKAKTEKSKRFAIFGLGNPGKEYENTRHNIGFLTVDSICHQYNLSLSKTKAQSLYTEWKLGNHEIILAQPQTYMNLSGKAVRGLSDAFNVLKPNIIVVYDDIYLPLGTIRTKDNGSSGGQNGVEDILRHLGISARFIRVRIGIGKQPGETINDMKRYVLKKFLPEEMEVVQKTIERAKLCIETIINEGIGPAMNRFNKSLEAYESQEQKQKKIEKERIKRQHREEWEKKQLAKQLSEQSQQ